MTAGDRPTFYPGIANDAMALNDLSRRVGQLEAMRAAPPLRIDTTPCGNVISMAEEAAASNSPANLWSGAGTPNINLTGDDKVASGLTLLDTGTYLIVGNLTTYITMNVTGDQSISYKFLFTSGAGTFFEGGQTFIQSVTRLSLPAETFFSHRPICLFANVSLAPAVFDLHLYLSSDPATKPAAFQYYTSFLDYLKIG